MMLQYTYKESYNKLWGQKETKYEIYTEVGYCDFGNNLLFL